MTTQPRPSRGWLWCGAALAAIVAATALHFASVRRNERNARLVQAVSTSASARVTELLNQGADPNTKYLYAFNLSAGSRYGPTGKNRVEHWRPLLILAAWRGDAEIVRAMLDRGADPKAVDEGGRSALMYAQIYSHPEVAELLLDHGADVNAADRAGNTALTCAASKGDVAAIRLLREHGATLDARVQNGQTPLMVAAARGKADAVKALVSLGADVHLQDWYGRTAADAAEKEGHVGIARLLRRTSAGGNR